ncbi:MAG: FadR family transcriptional regulator [Gemmatimonadaceae bacterium]|nr:FadR family transcriptional regulator [Gemmatimonadaceae bacterium]
MSTIARQSLADATAAQLEARIAAAEWPLGSRLPAEPELMAQLGVGRSTVREAIRTLARVGLVQVRQGDGTYVTARTANTESLLTRCQRAQLQEVRDVREALELQAARLAAARRTPDDLATLRTLLDQRADAITRRDAAGFAAADVAFHQRIVAATRNDMLIELWRVLGESLVQSLTERKRESAFDDADSTREHEALFDAIADADPGAATSAVTALFLTARPARDRSDAGAAVAT